MLFLITLFLTISGAYAQGFSLTQTRYKIIYTQSGNTQKMSIKGSLIVSPGESQNSLLNAIRDRLEFGMDLKLVLDVFGGDLAFVNKIYDALKAKNSRIITEVEMFRTCASACIPLFMVGDERVSAERSNWGFHQAATLGGYVMIPFMSEYVLRTKGVNTAWLKKHKKMFQTLKITWLEALELNGSGIITKIKLHPK